MRSLPTRLHATLALVAWFMQLCLPVAHASIMASPRAEMLGWCGDPSRLIAVAASMPADIRKGLGLDDLGIGANHGIDCATLCATGSAPTTTAVARDVARQRVGFEPAPAIRPAPRFREQATRPPSHGPPVHAP